MMVHMVYTLESFDSPRSTGLRITTNTFNTAYRAIHIDKFDAPKISSNIITNNISSDYSIYLKDCSEDFQILKNKISTSYNAGSGIRILDCLIGSGRSLIANNFIQACDEGISLNNVSDVDIYFNSINIEISSDLPYPASAALDLHETCRDINIINNIFNNRREGYAFKCQSFKWNSASKFK
ncbi:MAG: right-handed parallel beta-helix repeat-containing protein [Ignavibacteriales bacterium]|nr:right-handed parallel beta-helix repeat-containing protein [Ignavibacteriales bacterium]